MAKALDKSEGGSYIASRLSSEAFQGVLDGLCVKHNKVNPGKRIPIQTFVYYIKLVQAFVTFALQLSGAKGLSLTQILDFQTVIMTLMFNVFFMYKHKDNIIINVFEVRYVHGLNFFTGVPDVIKSAILNTLPYIISLNVNFVNKTFGIPTLAEAMKKAEAEKKELKLPIEPASISEDDLVKFKALFSAAIDFMLGHDIGVSSVTDVVHAQAQVQAQAPVVKAPVVQVQVQVQAQVQVQVQVQAQCLSNLAHRDSVRCRFIFLYETR